MLRRTVGLIPRYNWDFTFGSLLRSYGAIAGMRRESSDGIEKLFHCRPVLTTSGRASLYAILKALNIPTGSRIGVPLFCCPVVFDAIAQAGFVPAFIDCDATDFNISANDLARKRGHLSALVVAHMFGQPADMDALNALCRDIPVIEDCAHSLYSTYHGTLTGLLSTASFFSFRSGKYLSVGEGSAIICRDNRLRGTIAGAAAPFEPWGAARELLFSSSTYVKSLLYRRPWYGTLGYPIGRRLDRKLNLSAKSGFALRTIAHCHLDAINNRLRTFEKCVDLQREHAAFLLDAIRDDCIALPHERADCTSNYYQFVIRLMSSKRRDYLNSYLLRRGIDTARYLDDIFDTVRAHYGYSGGCPNAEHCSKTVLVIPHHYTLSWDDMHYVADQLNAGLAASRDL